MKAFDIAILLPLLTALATPISARGELLASLQPTDPSAGIELYVHVVSTHGPQCFPPAANTTSADGDVYVRLSITDSCQPDNVTTERLYSIGSFVGGVYFLRVEFCVLNLPPFPADCRFILRTPFQVGGGSSAVPVPVDSKALNVGMLVLLAALGVGASGLQRRRS
jgi:hypothetical protein